MDVVGLAKTESKPLEDAVESAGFPHSAVGVHVAQDHLGVTPMVTLATAHPAKFPDAVEQASGIRPPLPPRMADLYDRPERVTRVPNDLTALEALVLQRTGRA